MALRSRFSRATTLTSSISAPARSMVAGTTSRPGRSGASVIRSCSGSPSTSASYVDGMPRWCSTPSAVEALPCGSRSITSTRWPSWARAAATLTVVVVLPTPPFWLATTITRVASGRGIGGRRAASWRARTVSSAIRARGVLSSSSSCPTAAKSAAVRTGGRASTDSVDVSRETEVVPSASGLVITDCG